MSPSGTPDHPIDFVNVRLDEIRRAIDLYLGIAYDGSTIPDAVRRRLEWDPTKEANTLLTAAPFENVGKGTSGCPIVALRLGNAHYPHMKLQIQTWHSPDGFLLSVNTHDQVLTLDPKSPDILAFRALQAENQRVKERIESSWEAAGLPTFLSYLRDYLAAQSSPTDRL
jgi:hypothetical protein